MQMPKRWEQPDQTAVQEALGETKYLAGRGISHSSLRKSPCQPPTSAALPAFTASSPNIHLSEYQRGNAKRLQRTRRLEEIVAVFHVDLQPLWRVKPTFSLKKLLSFPLLWTEIQRGTD